MKVVEKNKRQFIQTNFMYIHEEFVKKGIQPKYLSLLLTCTFHRSVTERVRLKMIFTSGGYTVIQRLCIE